MSKASDESKPVAYSSQSTYRQTFYEWLIETNENLRQYGESKREEMLLDKLEILLEETIDILLLLEAKLFITTFSKSSAYKKLEPLNMVITSLLSSAANDDNALIVALCYVIEHHITRVEDLKKSGFNTVSLPEEIPTEELLVYSMFINDKLTRKNVTSSSPSAASVKDSPQLNNCRIL